MCPVSHQSPLLEYKNIKFISKRIMNNRKDNILHKCEDLIFHPIVTKYYSKLKFNKIVNNVLNNVSVVPSRNRVCITPRTVDFLN